MAIPQEASKRGKPNLELELQRVVSIDRRPRPLPAIHTIESVSDYAVVQILITYSKHLNMSQHV